MKNKKLLQQIIKSCGNENQVNQAIEELSELILAISKYKRHYKQGKSFELVRDLCGEIADVQIMINQLKLIFGVQAVDALEEIKLKRTEKRLKKGELC